MDIRFNGCGDPGAFLKRKAEEYEARHNGEEQRSVREYFDEVDAGKRAPMHGVYWMHDYKSWDEYKEAMIAAEDRQKAYDAMLECFRRMSLRSALSVMQGIKSDGPVSDAEVASFADRLKQDLGVRLAADYKVYLSACGRISIGGIEQTGMDPSGDYDLSDAIREARAEFGVPDRYYPLAAIDSVKTSAIAVFQDVDGYVYALDEDGSFEPAYESLLSYFTGLWYSVEEDLI